MERGPKIATAAGVFMAGLAVAMLFRHDGSRVGAAPPEDFNHLVLRGRMDLDAPIAPAATSSSTETVNSSSVGSLVSATSTAGGGSNKTATIPGALSSSATSQPYTWPMPKQSVATVPVSPSKPLRRHRITDGDTLVSLADRYLDTVDRANEIYELNREVLPGPGLLPIGTEIKLPPRDATHTSAKTSSQLVPLPPRS